jgi:Secretion system C-terminal sorting domain
MQKTLRTFLSFLTLIGISISVIAQPANDDCADATVVTLGTGQAFTTIDATTDGPGHPSALCFNAGTDTTHSDVWYSFTATSDIWVLWSVCDLADFDTRMVVYNAGAACPVADGDLLVCNDDFGDCLGFTGQVTFEVSNGSTYLLRLGGYGEAEPGEQGSGTFDLVETTPPPIGPENDFCADAIEVFLGAGQDFETTDATTDGPAHPSALCFAFGDDFVNADIWYSFTAPSTGTVEWSTCNMQTWDSRMAVYNAGATCPLSDEDLLVCNDDGPGCDNFTSYLTFDMVEGETYLLRLGGFTVSDTGTGTFDLNEITPPEPPANDSCLVSPDSVFLVPPEAADIGEGVNSGTTISATQDGGVPSCVNNGEFSDVWFKFNNEGITDIEVRFLVVTDSSGFIFEIFEDCSTPAPDTANGGILSNPCFSIIAGDVFVVDTITGFPDVATDYWVRVSTRITFDDPGEFWFQLVSEEAVLANEEQYLIENASIFPNPVKGLATVDLNLKESAQTTFEVFNGLGQTVYREEKGRLMQGNHQFELATSSFGSGIYFLKIAAGEKQKILKFVKL